MDIQAGNPPATPIMKGIPAYSLLVKVARGVFQRCVETTLEQRILARKGLVLPRFFQWGAGFSPKYLSPEVETYP